MPKIEADTPVDADLQTVWRVLLDRIERPERYLAGVEACAFPENTETYAVRELMLAGAPLRERITIDERQGEIRYELADHPLFTGDVINALIPPAPDDPKATPIVQFRMDWQPRGDEARAIEAEIEPTLRESMRDAVLFVKQVAEKQAKTGVQ